MNALPAFREHGTADADLLFPPLSLEEIRLARQQGPAQGCQCAACRRSKSNQWESA